MTSQINNQFESIQQLCTPTGVNLTSSPSLSPSLAGCLGYDAVNSPTSLFISNGTSWNNVGNGGAISQGSSMTATGVVFTGTASQPSFTGTLKIIQMKVGAVTMNLFDLDINQTITTTSAATWSCPAGTITSSFLTTRTVNIPLAINSTTSSATIGTYLTINTNGSMSFITTFSLATTSIYTVSSVYYV